MTDTRNAHLAVTIKQFLTEPRRDDKVAQQQRCKAFDILVEAFDTFRRVNDYPCVTEQVAKLELLDSQNIPLFTPQLAFLALHYFYHDDLKKFLFYLNRAKATGFPHNAIVVLEALYRFHHHKDDHGVEFKRLCNIAINLGYAFPAILMAKFRENSKFVDQKITAVEYYKIAASRHSPEGYFRLAKFYLETSSNDQKGMQSEAMKLLSAASNQFYASPYVHSFLGDLKGDISLKMIGLERSIDIVTLGKLWHLYALRGEFERAVLCIRAYSYAEKHTAFQRGRKGSRRDYSNLEGNFPWRVMLTPAASDKVLFVDQESKIAVTENNFSRFYHYSMLQNNKKRLNKLFNAHPQMFSSLMRSDLCPPPDFKRKNFSLLFQEKTPHAVNALTIFETTIQINTYDLMKSFLISLPYGFPHVEFIHASLGMYHLHRADRTLDENEKRRHFSDAVHWFFHGEPSKLSYIDDYFIGRFLLTNGREMLAANFGGDSQMSIGLQKNWIYNFLKHPAKNHYKDTQALLVDLFLPAEQRLTSDELNYLRNEAILVWPQSHSEVTEMLRRTIQTSLPLIREKISSSLIMRGTFFVPPKIVILDDDKDGSISLSSQAASPPPSGMNANARAQ